MIRALVLGGTGQVGGALRSALAGHESVIFVSRGECDLAKPDEIRAALRRFRPALVVNAAAYTAVDAAEVDQEGANAINAVAPGILAEELRRQGATLVHISTDYVYDGLKSSPYVETDLPAPLSVYGRSKLDGERAIQDSGVPYCVFRTSWVYAETGRNFFLTMLRLFAEGKEVRVVNDQTGCPNYAGHLARWIAVQVLEPALAAGTSFLEERRGIYHLTADGSTTWYGFAQAILERASKDKELASRVQGTRLYPISSDDFPTRVRRPAMSLLDMTRTRSVFGAGLPGWQAGLDECFAQFVASHAKQA